MNTMTSDELDQLLDQRAGWILGALKSAAERTPDLPVGQVWAEAIAGAQRDLQASARRARVCG